MIDFDDLDEAEGHGNEAPIAASSPTLTEYLPPIRRNFRLPDFDRLPRQFAEKVLGRTDLHLQARKNVCIRAFVFYGAGDTWYAWAQLAADAPEFCEVAVHEWPSHGDADTSRREEQPPASLEALANDAFRAVRDSLEQHVAGGRAAGAPFALIGHSIGCLLVVALAKKIREELGLEPAAVIMMDRAAPHLALHSEYGKQFRRDNPSEFMKIYNYPIYAVAQEAMRKSPEKGQRMLQLWIDDIAIASDVRPVGFHVFDCDVLVLRATHNFVNAKVEDGWTEDQIAVHSARDRLMGSPPGFSCDFSPEQYDEWALWCKPGALRVLDVNTTHMGVKGHEESWKAIWALLSEKKAPDPKA